MQDFDWTLAPIYPFAEVKCNEGAMQIENLRISIAVWMVVLLLGFSPGCSPSPSVQQSSQSQQSSQREQRMASFNLSTIADSFGNQDGTTTEAELKSLNTFFAQHPEGWCLGAFPLEYEQVKQVPAKAVASALKTMQLQGPYKSEAELRKMFADISIRTPVVGIYRLRSLDGKVEVIQYFRAPGPTVAQGKWEAITVTD